MKCYCIHDFPPSPPPSLSLLLCREMRRILAALTNYGPANLSEVAAQFAALTLKDLGFYVSDTSALQYFKDQSYPITADAFLLENALNQCHFLSPENNEGKSTFVPFPWKNTADDIIGCSTLFESDQATLCWFVLPPGKTLPLHDHPSMHVLQKVLFGRIAVTSFDWANAAAKGSGGSAKVIFSGVVEGRDEPVDPADVLSFSQEGGGGVLHELRNVDDERPALFIDILAPPYHRDPGQLQCTYFTASKRVNGEDTVGVTGALDTLFATGDEAVLTPRKGFTGPEMNAFVRLG